MAYFQFLYEFILDQDKVNFAILEKRIAKLRHNFYSLSQNDIEQAFIVFTPFPIELKLFYEEIGFGYFHCNKERVNRIFDPYSLVQMNKKQDRFIYDIELKRSFVEGHLVFFQTYLNQFLTIEIKDDRGKNAIYYKNEKIANSLLDFLTYYDKDKSLFKFKIKEIDSLEIKKGLSKATMRNTFVYYK